MARAEQELMDRLRGSDVNQRVDLDATYTGDEACDPHVLHAKEIYFGLLTPQSNELMPTWSRLFLSRQLDSVTRTDTDLPDDMDDLPFWMESNTATVGAQYRQYLAERKNGRARRYFATKSHALHFLKAVAPTKLVDGAWLYGLISQWRDPRYVELVRIYLEELGDGEADRNHVLIYRKLLARHECTQWENLDDTHFVQGAIQLSLAQHARERLPEIIGFNLGYEQLPLHLLICSYELDELGIDPYYFRLHVTIDNASTGHAARAVQAVMDAVPRLGDKRAFYQRIRNGYRLNSLGASTNTVIANFNLEQELLAILASKAAVGAQLHSDYCRIAGKTVNEWLSAPSQIRNFLDALEQQGWIRRNERPEGSRFWKLLVDKKAPMFGVFTAYERQILYDWIAGDDPRNEVANQCHRAQERMRNASRDNCGGERRPDKAVPDDDFSSELNLLSNRLAGMKDKSAAMDMLVPWLSPIHHHTPLGLKATRLFVQQLQT
jgi:hypothetical protein